MSSKWTWVWIVVAVVLVIGMALRRAPVQGSPPTAGLLASATAAEADESPEQPAWKQALRRPDRRKPFLEAAAEMDTHWENDADVRTIAETLLTMPRYSASATWYFIGQQLLRTDDPVEMRRRADAFGQFGGEGYAQGLRAELRAYIERNPEAATRPHRTALDAIGEAMLEPAEGAVIEVPAVEIHTLTQFVDLLPADLDGPHEAALAQMLDKMAGVTHDVYHPLDRRIGETHDYLALACGRYLWDDPKHEDRIRRYLTRRLDRSEHYGTAIRQMLKDLDAR